MEERCVKDIILKLQEKKWKEEESKGDRNDWRNCNDMMGNNGEKKSHRLRGMVRGIVIVRCGIIGTRGAKSEWNSWK